MDIEWKKSHKEEVWNQSMSFHLLKLICNIVNDSNVIAFCLLNIDEIRSFLFTTTI